MSTYLPQAYESNRNLRMSLLLSFRVGRSFCPYNNQTPWLSSTSCNMADEKEKPSVRVIDAESFNDSTDLQVHGDGRLVRQLKNRHMAMISIGGVVGTGPYIVYHPILSTCLMTPRPLLGYQQCFGTWWPPWSSSGLHGNGHRLLLRHGKHSIVVH